MKLPKINGRVDTESVSDIILYKIIDELEAMSSPSEREKLRHFIKGILVDVICISNKKGE